MKKSTKKAFKKFGKAFVKAAKVTGREAYEMGKEGVSDFYEASKEGLKSLKPTRRSIVQTQQFQRGANEYLDQVIPQRQNLSTSSAVNRATFQPVQQTRIVKVKGQKYVDLRPMQRRPVSSMLASDALRI